MAAATTLDERCGANNFDAALFHQKDMISNLVDIEIEKSNNFMIGLIKMGKKVDLHDDGTMIKMYTATQAPKNFRDYGEDVFNGMEIEPGIQGSQEVRDGECGSASATLPTLVNKTAEDACEGSCEVNFAQGWELEGCVDRRIALHTPPRCVEEMGNLKRTTAAKYLRQERKSLAQVAVDSLAYELLGQVIARGGANASVKQHTEENVPILTSGGWNGPPTSYLSIWFLEGYRTQIVRRMRNAGMRNSDNYILTIECTREAVERAIAYDISYRSGPGGISQGLGGHHRIDGTEISEIANGKLKGRQSYIYKGYFRFVFIQNPIKGFFRPTSGGQYEFVRVYETINVPAERMGYRDADNPQYYQDCVECGGVEYPMVELAAHVHPSSFRRHGISVIQKPDGTKKVREYDFSIDVKDGAYLSSKDCINMHDNYYMYVMRGAYRWCDKFPDLSGIIAMLCAPLQGYSIPVNEEKYRLNNGDVGGSLLEQLEECDVEGCFECEEEPDCSDPQVSVGGCSSECVQNPIAWLGEDVELQQTFTRPKECATGALELEVELIEGTALEGVHVDMVDENGNPVGPTAIVQWADGESGTKTVCFTIKNAIMTTDNGLDECCNELDPTLNLACFEVKASVLTGTASFTDSCDTAKYCIRNWTDDKGTAPA